MKPLIRFTTLAILCVVHSLFAQTFFKINPPTILSTNTVRLTLSGASTNFAYIIYSSSNPYAGWVSQVTGAVGQLSFDVDRRTDSIVFYRAALIGYESSVAFTNAAYVVSEAGTSVSINVVRSGALTNTVSADYRTVDGSAVSTNDYRGTNGTLTFPANTAVKTITIPIANDTLVESNQSFMVVLFNPQGRVQLGALTNTTVTILDNDQGGVISFSATSYTVTEAGANATITLTRSGGSASGVTVDFITTDGSATAGLDYSNATCTVSFAANETSKTVLVPIRNDSLDEPNETVLLSLSNPTGGASLGTPNTATLTITDDDVAGVINFSAASYSTNENAGAARITVTRSGGSASGVTVDFATQDGTATAGSDYQTSAGTLTFGSNIMSQTFTIPLLDDTLPEGDETVLLKLSNTTGGATLGSISNAVLRIIDDESSVSFTNTSYTVSEAGPSISINVVRSGALTTTVSVDYSTWDYTAFSPADYRGTNGTLTFPPNTAFKTITIPIVNDTIVEGSEAFGLSLENPQGGVQLGTLTDVFVTIQDNDSPPPGRLYGSIDSYFGDWSFGIVGEDFSYTQSAMRYEYNSLGQVSRQYGTIFTVLTGHTYSFDAYFTYNSFGRVQSVQLTMSGGILNPSTQTITF